GSSETWLACLASSEQPLGQLPQHTTPLALRDIGPLEAPSASAPIRQSSAFRPAFAGSTGCTDKSRSTPSKSCSSSEAQPIPNSSRQRSSTASGARKHVPEFTTVVPP